MKAGFNIEHYCIEYPYICVFNWEYSNTVMNFGLEDKLLSDRNKKSDTCLGRWQPKGTKEKQLK